MQALGFSTSELPASGIYDKTALDNKSLELCVVPRVALVAAPNKIGVKRVELYGIEWIYVRQQPQPCIPAPEAAWKFRLNKIVCLDLDRSRNYFRQSLRAVLEVFKEERPEVVSITNRDYMLVITVKKAISRQDADMAAGSMFIYLKSFDVDDERLIIGPALAASSPNGAIA